jgi:hypothetical protein
MIVRRLSTAYALLTFLEQDDPVVRQVRGLLHQDGCFPSRRTWERRLAAFPETLPGLIGYFGRHLVGLLKPWAAHGRAVACDSTALRTSGGLWHKKHKATGDIPQTSIDCEAGWSKSGWHGWWYGWKLHLAVTVGAIWIPLAAELTVANIGDNEVAPKLLEQLPAEVRYVLGDTMTLHCAPSAISEAVNWLPHAVGLIHTQMVESRCGASFTSFVRNRLNLSMVCSKMCLGGTARCRSKAWDEPNSWPSVRSFFTNWFYCTNTNNNCRSARASSHF